MENLKQLFKHLLKELLMRKAIFSNSSLSHFERVFPSISLSARTQPVYWVKSWTGPPHVTSV